MKQTCFLSTPGIVTALGIGITENINNILKSKCALSIDENFLNRPIYVGKIKEKLEFIKEDDFNTRTNQLLLTAVLQIDDLIKKAIKKYGKDKVGVVLGTTTSGVEENLAFFKYFQKHNSYDKNLYNHKKQSLANPALFLKHFYNLTSPCFCISTACTSGAKALMYAKRLIEANICDAVICGGVDSLNALTLHGFDSLFLLSESISKPFSKNRDGINIGEGAEVFLCSRDEISNVYLSSYASNSDAFHITQPNEKATMPIKAIQKALKDANLINVDYINLHATGTKANDKMESMAFYETLPTCKASSTKPLIGHTLGAAGAIEAAFCHELIVRKKTALPIHVNDKIEDEDLKKINLIKNHDIYEVSSALSSSFAFGGDNAILILKRKED